MITFTSTALAALKPSHPRRLLPESIFQIPPVKDSVMTVDLEMMRSSLKAAYTLQPHVLIRQLDSEGLRHHVYIACPRCRQTGNNDPKETTNEYQWSKKHRMALVEHTYISL